VLAKATYLVLLLLLLNDGDTVHRLKRGGHDGARESTW